MAVYPHWLSETGTPMASDVAHEKARPPSRRVAGMARATPGLRNQSPFT